MVKAQPRAVRVNNVMMTDAQQSSRIVIDRFLVSSVPATVLFDSGASHSFVSQRFAHDQVLTVEDLPKFLPIVSPGSKLTSSIRAPFVRITIQGCHFPASLIVLPSSDIDVILGMDWLVQHKANIDCPTRSVKLTHDLGAEVLYTCGSMTGPAQLYALNAGVAPFLEEVKVVCEFLDVFP